MLEVTIAICVGGIVFSVVMLIRSVQELIAAVRELKAEVSNLRLNSRARVVTAKVRSGAASEESELRRLGRASKARRIVVGGDDDSQLNRDLTRGLPVRSDAE